MPLTRSTCSATLEETMTGPVEPPQLTQELQYVLPYHFLPQRYGSVFRQTLTMSWGYEYLSYIEFITRLVGREAFASLIDVGCGDGRLLHELRQAQCEPRLVGIDFSQRAIDFARLLTSGVEFVCGDVTAEPDLRNAFDVVTAIEVLEHVPPGDCENFVRGLCEVLKPGGRLILSVPSVNIPLKEKHYRHFDEELLLRTLAPCFRITNTHFLNCQSWWTRWILEPVLCNRLFILNHPRLLGALYRFYCRRLLPAHRTNCRRILVECVKRTEVTP